VDRNDDALRQLPDTYATALRLREQGHSTTTIAEALGVDLNAIDSLLELADAKLARLLRAEPADHRAPSVPATGEPA
jgi:DNA-directed RNA polymerase specialized sigma24 family protein